MATPGRRRERSTTTEVTKPGRSPGARSADDTVPLSPPTRTSPEEIDAQTRDRRNRVRIIVAASALLGLGLLALAAGVVLRDGSGSDVGVDLQRAFDLQNRGQLDEAAAIYRDIIAAEPDTTIAYFNLGVIEETKGDDAEAAASFEQVLALDPRYSPALFNLALLRADGGDTEEAIALYRRVIAVDPDYAPAFLNLGLILLYRGENVEATELIGRAIEIDPTLANTDGHFDPHPAAPGT